MRTATMGRVLVKAEIENLADLLLVEQGTLAPDKVHRLENVAVLVDAGSTYLAMPRKLIRQLGFKKPFGAPRMRTAKGLAKVNLYGPVRLSLKDRYCRVDVAETAEGNPVLIGQVPLELMDFVVDPRGRKLIGNPEHGGHWMIDMF